MKMRLRTSILLLPLALLSLYSCNSDNKTEEQTGITKKPKVGDTRDEHGCITSAGYVWSIAKDTCLRLWESAAELEPTNYSELVVYAIISSDKKKAEIYIPDGQSVLLTEKGNNTYTSDSLTLTVTGNIYTLKKNGKAIYQTASAIPAEEPKPARRKKR